MRKGIILLFSLLFMFSVSDSTTSATVHNPELENVQKVVDKANQDIDQKVDKAIRDADQLIAKSAAKLQAVEDSKKIKRLEAEFNVLKMLLEENGLKEKEVEKLYSEKDKVSKKLADEKKKQAKKKESIEVKLDKDLDKLIEKVVNDTNKIADQTIRYGEQRGFEIICEYITVNIGGRDVLIDPLRVGI